MYNLSRAEQETTIRWDAEENVAHIFTAHPVTLRKLEKLAAEFTEVYRLTRTDSANRSKWFDVDARFIRFGKPASEAQREAVRNASKNTQFLPKTTV